MALAVYCQLNPQVRPFLPTVMAPKLAYRRGKREGGEDPVNKHQIRSGDGRWEGRRGVGRLNPRRETKTKGRNGDRERKMRPKPHSLLLHFVLLTDAVAVHVLYCRFLKENN